MFPVALQIVLTLCLPAAVCLVAPVRPLDRSALQDRQPKDRATSTAPDDGALSTQMPGIALAKQQVWLMSPVEGAILELPVVEGQSVRQGETLVVIDDRVSQASLRAAEAAAHVESDTLQAESECRLAQSVLHRTEQAHQRQAASELELEEARHRFQSGQAAVLAAHERKAQAEAQLELERAKNEAHRLRAPFDGVLQRIDVQIGQTVLRTLPVLQLINADTLRVELFLPQEWYARLEVGQEYLLLAGTPIDQTVTGRLVHAERAIDPATSAFRCAFEIDNRTLRLPPGFVVYASRIDDSLAPQTITDATATSPRAFSRQ